MSVASAREAEVLLEFPHELLGNYLRKYRNYCVIFMKNEAEIPA